MLCHHARAQFSVSTLIAGQGVNSLSLSLSLSSLSLSLSLVALSSGGDDVQALNRTQAHVLHSGTRPQLGGTKHVCTRVNATACLRRA